MPDAKNLLNPALPRTSPKNLLAGGRVIEERVVDISELMAQGRLTQGPGARAQTHPSSARIAATPKLTTVPTLVAAECATQAVNSHKTGSLPYPRSADGKVPEESIFKSRYAEVDIANTTLTQELLNRCDAFGGNVAMIDGVSGVTWTFQKLSDDSRALAGGLASLGFGQGSIAAIYLPNMPQYFVVFNGVLLPQGVATTLNPTYGGVELEHTLDLTYPQVIFTMEALLPNISEAASRTGLEPLFVLVEERDQWTQAANPQQIALSELLQPGAPFEEVTDPNAVAVLPYSSGTTGLPKAVMLTHRNFVSQLYQLGTYDDLVKLGPKDVLLAVLPFFHIYGMVVILGLAVWSGAKVVTIPKFIPELYLKLLKEHDVTIAHVAPPLVNFLVKHPLVDQYLPLPALRELFCGAAPLDDDTAAAAKTKLDLQFVRQGYGMTEMSPASHIGPRSNPKGGSIGILVPNMEMKLISPLDGQPCTGPNQQGELWLRGPNIMMGYYNDEQATLETIDADGFLHTGDVGYLDEDGQIWIVDRIKELIKVKGFQVAPAELEAALTKHTNVNDAAVIGVAAGYSYGGQIGDGQLAKAFVVRKDPSVTEEELKDFVKGLLKSPYKQLAAVQFIEAVPKSASGKILRKDLRKMEEDAGGKIFG